MYNSYTLWRLVKDRQQQALAEAMTARLTSEARQSRPRLWHKLLGGFGDLLIALGYRLKPGHPLQTPSATPSSEALTIHR